MAQFIERPEGMPPTNGYRHVAIAPGATVFISGQVPLNAAGELVGDDAITQAEQVFANLGSALAAVGLTWSNVVKLTY